MFGNGEFVKLCLRGVGEACHAEGEVGVDSGPEFRGVAGDEGRWNTVTSVRKLSSFTKFLKLAFREARGQIRRQGVVVLEVHGAELAAYREDA